MSFAKSEKINEPSASHGIVREHGPRGQFLRGRAARRALAGVRLALPYAKLLTARTSLGVTIGGFAAYWAIALAIVWLPAFLIKACGYTPSQTGWIVVAPSALQLVVIPGAGFLSQKLLGHGVPSRISRGLFACACILLAGASMNRNTQSYKSWVQVARRII